MIKILFICHGNICRSPMAEFVMREYVKRAGLETTISVASAATSTEELGHDTHYGTRAVLEREGIPFHRRAARQTTKHDYTEYDFICGMDMANMRNMKRIYGGDPERKLSLLLDRCGGGEVADPWYTGNFDATWADITRGCSALLEKLKKELNESWN